MVLSMGLSSIGYLELLDVVVLSFVYYEGCHYLCLMGGLTLAHGELRVALFYLALLIHGV